MAKGTKEYSVPALDKAIMILNALSENELSAADLHTSLKLPKTTTFVILNTLEQHAIIYKNPDGTYRLGPGVLHWATRFLGSIDLVQFARPHLSALVQDTPYTGHLAVLVDNKAVYCDKVEGNGFVRFATSVGQGQPLHQSAVGKALLADHQPKQLELLIPEINPIDDDKAARTMEKWMDDIQFVRDHGFSIEDEEFEEGVRCIGAPIRNHQGFIVAAISITSLSRDLPAVKFMSVGSQVKAAALAISQAIGYLPTAAEKPNKVTS
ncbi:IclR family transcriptional regulator [Paenibacillus senegalensis]|uniref:IclR family transcriptional regulator n=1 Tax=Paenibacillus senegalensis TaxID=1465766 RepID=UPI0002FAACA4|nr:IclR family transcriptional regulator [Paenibacillus senegalensis]